MFLECFLPASCCPKFLLPAGKMSAHMLDMSEFGESAEYLRKSYEEQMRYQNIPFDGKKTLVVSSRVDTVPSTAFHSNVAVSRETIALFHLISPQMLFIFMQAMEISAQHISCCGAN